MEKFELITRNLAEVVGQEELRQFPHDQPFKIYWGTAPTGKPHLGYFIPIRKIADFLTAGCEVIILFADLHAVLEGKTDLQVLEARCDYYEVVITAMLKQIGVKINQLKFIRGTSFQLDPNYTMDLYRLLTINTVNQAKKAGSEVVKIDEDPILSKVIYPLLQCLDEKYLKVDAQLGGVDQRKIFMSARENLPKINHTKQIHLMNPLISGLGKFGKMTSSEPDSKIDFEDSDDIIAKKLWNAFSVDGVDVFKFKTKKKKKKKKKGKKEEKEEEEEEEEIILSNCLLMLLKHLVFPFLQGQPFRLIRDEKYGGSVDYINYEELHRDFVEKKVASPDLKISLVPEIVKLISPIRDLIQSQYEELSKRAYPKN